MGPALCIRVENATCFSPVGGFSALPSTAPSPPASGFCPHSGACGWCRSCRTRSAPAAARGASGSGLGSPPLAACAARGARRCRPGATCCRGRARVRLRGSRSASMISARHRFSSGFLSFRRFTISISCSVMWRPWGSTPTALCPPCVLHLGQEARPQWPFLCGTLTTGDSERGPGLPCRRRHR